MSSAGVSRPPFGRILIATDGSDCARGAVEQGLSLAAALGGAVMFVVVRQAPLPVLRDPYHEREVSRELASAQAAADDAMQAAEGVPIEIVLVVQSLIVLFIAAPPLVRTIFRLPDPDRRKRPTRSTPKEVVAK